MNRFLINCSIKRQHQNSAITSIAVNPIQKYLSSNLKRTYSTTNKEYQNEIYQILHKSTLPSMYFQKSLPRLPIPQLEKTCEKYLNSLKPILIDECYRKTETCVESFKNKSGKELQNLLKNMDKNNKHTSYISEPWFDMYLRDRKPLPINYNPLLIMKQDNKIEYNNQLVRAANIVVSSLRFMKSLKYGYLSPEIFHLNPKKSDTENFRKIIKLAPTNIATYIAYVFKAFPLDMSQYDGLFGATRIPELDKDRIYRNTNAKHLLVLHKGNFYSIDVLDDNGYIESPNVILGRLKQVLFDRNIPDAEVPLGCLTTSERNNWANLRHHLCSISSKNEKSMKIIDSALFCLCLDDIKYDENNPIPLVKHYLGGDGINRWFDKSLSVFVGKDGITAINFEHSWGDGVAVLRYFNEIYNEITNSPQVHPNTVAHLNDNNQNAVNLVKFDFDDRIKIGVDKARKYHDDIVNKLNINMIRNSDINKKICKKNHISPDSIMQLAFQLSYKQIYNKYVGTYESCSTAAFRHGRTETMRPCTIATKEFCDSIILNNKSISELRNIIEKCSDLHGKLTKDAAMGQGFDRHLFGLKHIAIKNDIKLPSLYNDIGYELINYNIISTSTLTSPGLVAGSFGPVVPDGLGVGYSIQDDECGSIVTSYEGKCNGKEFVESLNEAFVKIKNVLNVKN